MAMRKSAPLVHNATRGASVAADTVLEGGRSFKGFLKKFYNDWSLHLTQALTFGLISSLIPIAMLLLAIVGNSIGTLDPKARATLIDQVKNILPPPLSSSSQDIVTSALQKLPQSSALLALIGIIAALFFGSRLFTLLEACFDFIYHVPQRPFKKKNLVALAMLVLFMILTPVLVLASLIPDQALGILQHTTAAANSNLTGRIAGILSSLIVSFLLFEVLYTFVPNRQGALKYRLRSSVRGAVTAAIVLQIGLILFPLYARNFASGLVGQVTYLLISLIFFYIIALVTLIGAEVNAYFSENIPAPTKDLVTRSSRSS